MVGTGGVMDKENKEDISDYLFVTLAAHRCRQLYDGAEPKVELKNKKLTRVAQEEVSKGLIHYKREKNKSKE
jgi:DNA-directed RNA polymerase subunit K/omega